MVAVSRLGRDLNGRPATMSPVFFCAAPPPRGAQVAGAQVDICLIIWDNLINQGRVFIMFDALPHYKHQLKEDKRNLSNVSKMPGFSISRSAYLCHVGQKLRKIKGSTCHKCYACKGMYTLRKPEFRWFDSGDVDTVRMGLNILEICEATPHLKHWIPSREYKIWADVLKIRNLPANVTLRMSAHMIDGAPSKGWKNTSTVASHGSKTVGHVCPAPLNDGKCGDCRACWDPKVDNVTYYQH